MCRHSNLSEEIEIHETKGDKIAMVFGVLVLITFLIVVIFEGFGIPDQLNQFFGQ